MDLVIVSAARKRASVLCFLSVTILFSACGKVSSPPSAIEPTGPAMPEESQAVSAAENTGTSLNDGALWEPAQPGAGKAWTAYAHTLVLSSCPSLLAGSQDVAQFCPKFHSLTEDQRASFWVYLVSAVTKYESGFNPRSRMREVGLGTDPVTHQPVYSEGLLQLSYQDALVYSFCDQFDWGRDRLLAPTDSQKTILDPYKNLQCGIRILDFLVARHSLIAFDRGNYWSTLMPNGRYGKVSSIKALTNQFTLCR